jgi:pSer/pThr/pTyr-binding forkhead associated (FHA) protein
MGAVNKIVLTANFTSGHTGSRAFTLKEGLGIIIGRLTNATEIVPPNALKFSSKVISRKHAQIFVIEDKVF